MNHMEEVARMLGVELGDIFKIYGERFKVVDEVFHINEKGLIDGDGRTWSGVLIRLITGEYTLKKIPWKPKNGDRYFAVMTDRETDCNRWGDDCIDFSFYFAGNCFKTEEEALAHAPEVIGKLRGKYEEDRS